MYPKIEIIFLGTGTSTGIPMVACNCNVCNSKNKKDKRLRSSILISINNYKILIDTTPDFRYQMLRENITNLDAILITHCHKDHLNGLDDLRAITSINKNTIPLFANKFTLEAIKRDFYYAFEKNKYPGLFDVNLNCIDNENFNFNEIPIIPIKVMHAKMEVIGFRIYDFTYITDANYINEQSLNKIKGSKILILNALRKEKHFSHFNLQEAIDISQKLEIPKVYFTHISHQLGFHKIVSKELPKNIFLAYDGLKIKI